MALQSKFLVYAAIVAMLGLMGAVIWYASLDNPDLEQVEIELTNVELISVNKVENSAKMQITFLVKNPSEKTFTVPLIAYQLYADGVLLGSGQYSTADIAMPGRAIFNSGAEIPLQNIFDVKGSEIENEVFQSIVDDKVTNFQVDGVITAESAWSLIEKEFESSV